jgi:hypothetical protein
LTALLAGLPLGILAALLLAGPLRILSALLAALAGALAVLLLILVRIPVWILGILGTHRTFSCYYPSKSQRFLISFVPEAAVEIRSLRFVARLFEDRFDSRFESATETAAE